MSGNHFDVIIMGGGLAGLTAACLLSERFATALIDPDAYPRHKLCGEYLSREVDPLLDHLNIDVREAGAVDISTFEFTDTRRNHTVAKLPLGGYGISRYALDHLLYNRCSSQTAVFQSKVTDCKFDDGMFRVTTVDGEYFAPLVLGAFGKRSTIDKALQRPFVEKRTPWMAVKMHYDYKMPDHLVQLHAFDGGYAGLSKVEDDKTNLCYLTTVRSFKKAEGITDFNRQVLSQNPSLNYFFSQAEPLWDKPIAISQIAFGEKSAVDDHILMIGDTAGLIHPLCGNGMAMAMHSAQIAAGIITSHFSKGKVQDISTHERYAIEQEYTKRWTGTFGTRMRYGRYLHRILLSESLCKVAYAGVAAIPGILPHIIRRTHGKPISV